MTTPTDHMTIAEIIHDFATRQGDLTDRGAREDLAAILEQRMVAERAGALREAADDYERMHQQPGSATGADWLRRRADREAS